MPLDTQDMKKFSKGTICPKCGLKKEYGYHGIEYVTRSHGEKSIEYLERTCGICGYQWKEACVEER